MIDKLKKVFHRRLTTAEMDMVGFMKGIPLFTGFTDMECADIIPLMYQRNYREGEMVFFRNDASQAIYLVSEGSVELSLDIGDKDEDLFECRSRSAFGINSIIKGRNRDFNARITSERAELYVIAQSDIFQLFEHDIKIQTKLLNNLAVNYDDMFAKLFKIYRNNIGFFELKNVF